MTNDRQNQSNLSETRSLTKQLHTSGRPRWRNLRGKLQELGIDPTDAAVAYIAPDGQTLEEGLLVVRDGRVYVFTLDFGWPEPLDPENGEIWAWEEEHLGTDKSVDLRIERAEIAMRVLNE